MATLCEADTLSVVEEVYAAWAERDLAGTLRWFADDVVYTMHVPQDLLWFAGAQRGKTALARCLQAILDEYGFLAYVVDNLAIEGEHAHAQVVYSYRHQGSGQELSGRFRHVWHVQRGRAVLLDEYHDVEMLRAFLTMVSALRAGN